MSDKTEDGRQSIILIEYADSNRFAGRRTYPAIHLYVGLVALFLLLFVRATSRMSFFAETIWGYKRYIGAYVGAISLVFGLHCMTYLFRRQFRVLSIIVIALGLLMTAFLAFVMASPPLARA